MNCVLIKKLNKNMSLQEFSKTVNNLAAKQCEIFNLDKNRIFGAEVFDLPESFYRSYYESGLTPEQTLEEMNENCF